MDARRIMGALLLTVSAIAVVQTVRQDAILTHGERTFEERHVRSHVANGTIRFDIKRRDAWTHECLLNPYGPRGRRRSI